MSTPRQQGILNLAIKDKSALYSAYMPFIKNGGLFIPTNKPYQLGDEVFVLLQLIDADEKLPVAARVVWVTPRSTNRTRAPGIGIQFSEQDKGDTQRKIEALLGTAVRADRPTHTL
ncbi:MAG: PilZ domain-containing protein [Gammaproteobacteria bacterium]